MNESELEYPSDEVLIGLGKVVVRMLLEGQPVYVGRRGITIDGDTAAPPEVKQAIIGLGPWPYRTRSSEREITTPWDDDYGFPDV